MKLPKLPTLNESEEIKEKEESSVSSGRPRIPKSEFDSEGNPILVIPDLNDVQLNDEIDKYFGNYEEGD